MTITLDPDTEQRIQRQMQRGSFGDPAQLLAHALDVIEAEDEWLLQNRDRIAAHLEESFAQSERGETYSVEEARAILARRRATRTGK